MKIIHLTNRDEYEVATGRGFKPLLDWRHFVLPIDLRIEIQREIFGHSTISVGNRATANQRFYEWCWDNMPHFCQESMRPLHDYSAEFISHILSRGAHPEMAHDPRNVNILFTPFHNMWEDSIKRSQMKLYTMNLLIIDILRKDYSNAT